MPGKHSTLGARGPLGQAEHVNIGATRGGDEKLGLEDRKVKGRCLIPVRRNLIL